MNNKTDIPTELSKLVIRLTDWVGIVRTSPVLQREINNAVQAIQELQRLQHKMPELELIKTTLTKQAMEQQLEITELEAEVRTLKALIPGQLEVCAKVDELQEGVDELEANQKQHAVSFFQYWWNQGGTNTEQGYDQWIKTLPNHRSK